jgi:hypothetical protein
MGNTFTRVLSLRATREAARYGAVEGARAGGFATPELHHHQNTLCGGLS